MSALREAFLAKVRRQVERAVQSGMRIAEKGGRPGDDAEVIAICIAALAEEYAGQIAAQDADGGAA